VLVLELSSVVNVDPGLTLCCVLVAGKGCSDAPEAGDPSVVHPDEVRGFEGLMAVAHGLANSRNDVQAEVVRRTYNIDLSLRAMMGKSAQFLPRIRGTAYNQASMEKRYLRFVTLAFMVLCTLYFVYPYFGTFKVGGVLGVRKDSRFEVVSADCRSGSSIFTQASRVAGVI
jgi:hypothetical protein